MRESFKASAPGKLMLIGEHAVLCGRRCIVCAVDQRIQITVRPRRDDKISIDSVLGRYQTDLNRPHIDETFRFITTTIDQHKEFLNFGFDLTIESDFDATFGLGSSSAVTAAMTTAIFHMAGLELEQIKIFDHSLTTVRTVQGSGSGADLAASVFGGMLLYRYMPNEIVPLRHIHPITVVYSGSKMPTTKVIRLVEKKYKTFPTIFNGIYDAMDKSAESAASAINESNWPAVGNLLDINQGLMDAIGVNNQQLSRIVNSMREDAGILGAKISGSGLGDCVVGLGKPRADIGFHTIPIAMSSDGVRID